MSHRNSFNPAKPTWGAHATRVQSLATRQRLQKYNAKHRAFGKMEAAPFVLEVSDESPETARESRALPITF